MERNHVLGLVSVVPDRSHQGKGAWKVGKSFSGCYCFQKLVAQTKSSEIEHIYSGTAKTMPSYPAFLNMIK